MADPYGDGLPPPQPPTTIIPRCRQCDRRLAEYVGRPWSIRCPRCRTENRGV